jgi:hypothetical protein
MTRNTKFKAWDKKKRAFVFEGTIADIIRAAGKLNGRTMEWLESPGLQDKHQKAIYDGDILKYHNGRLSNPIEFPKDYVWLATRIESVEQGDWTMAVAVVGNMYENPELLQEKAAVT